MIVGARLLAGSCIWGMPGKGAAPAAAAADDPQEIYPRARNLD